MQSNGDHHLTMDTCEVRRRASSSERRGPPHCPTSRRMEVGQHLTSGGHPPPVTSPRTHRLGHPSTMLLFLSTFLLAASLPGNVKALTLSPAHPNNTVGIKADGQFIITCIARKTPKKDVKLIWEHNGFEISNDVTKSIHVTDVTGNQNPPFTSDRSKNVKKVEDDTLQLRMLGFGRSDGQLLDGTYTCALIDKRTNRPLEKVDFHLFVYDPIRFQGKFDYTVQVGQSITMTCMVIVDPDYQTNTIYWHFNGSAIDPAKNSRYRISPDPNNKKSSLNIRNTVREDEGPYTCWSIPSSISFSDSGTKDYNLVVQYPPTFLQDLPGTVWVMNDASGMVDVNITCVVDANPTADFRWFVKDGMGRNSDLTREPYFVRISEREENLQTVTIQLRADEITMRGVKQRDSEERWFSCEARNRLGTKTKPFKIRRGSRPGRPQLISFSQEDNQLVLVIEEDYIHPAVDFYKITTESNYTLKFNASQERITANGRRRQVYTVELKDIELPKIREKARLSAHNPLGFSNETQETVQKPVTMFMVGGQAAWGPVAAPLTILLGLLTSTILLNRRE